MSRDIIWKDEVLSDSMIDEMAVNLNVFGLFVKYWILRNMQSNLTITKEVHGSR